jgi:hypothetical protein
VNDLKAMDHTTYKKPVMSAPDLVCLFHGLAGLCVGWIWAAPVGAFAGIAIAVVGFTAGIITGFLVGRLPRAVQMSRKEGTRKCRLLAGLLGILGSTMGIAFWWFSVSVMHR